MLSTVEVTHTYRTVRRIGKGGMGSVYEAVQVGAHGFEKRVAIKTLLPTLSHDTRFVEMFADEGKLVADLVHENIVQIYQLGLAPDGYYIVMEYVHGLPLHDFIHFHSVTRLQLPRELAVFMASRIARGLAYAHSRLDEKGRPVNIVHRDVCPNNILITTEGLPKLADFGIAKAAKNVMPANEQNLMGKQAYMSPEQAKRQPLDFRSDIFSLGMVLFELLALRLARGRRESDMLEAAKDGWVDWEQLPADLDPALLQILRRMLAVKLADRYPDTGQVAYDLEYFIYHKGYGPTVVTLENYLRHNFTYLYAGTHVPTKTDYRLDPSGATVLIADRTEVLGGQP